MDIKEAEKRGYTVVRQTQWYAIRPDGLWIILAPDWIEENAYRYRKRKGRKPHD